MALRSCIMGLGFGRSTSLRYLDKLLDTSTSQIKSEIYFLPFWVRVGEVMHFGFIWYQYAITRKFCLFIEQRSRHILHDYQKSTVIVILKFLSPQNLKHFLYHWTFSLVNTFSCCSTVNSFSNIFHYFSIQNVFCIPK